MVRRWVWARNLVNEKALAHYVLLRHIKKTISAAREEFRNF